VPLAQVTDAMTARNNRLFPLTWVVRTSMDPHAISGAAARELRAATGGLPVSRVRIMEEILAAPARRAAFTTTLLTAFAAIALLLAVALAAAIVPAHRATLVNPLDAVRG
jgi:hypothetical protein